MLIIPPGVDASRSVTAVTIAGVASMATGAFAALVLSATAKGGPYWSEGLQLVIYMFGAAMVASVLGLIFGVPRAREASGEPTSERFLANSNLEQISDWLTKILVGAGLVQLGALGTSFGDLGDFLGAKLLLPNGRAASVAMTIYGLGAGFTFTYLWTRLRLRVLLEESERQAREQSTYDRVNDSLQLLNAGSEEPEPPAVVSAIASGAVRRAETANATRSRSVLWVDDNPSNNTLIVRSLVDLGIRVDLARSTTEALERLDSRRYGVIISDLGRNEDGNYNKDAGLNLLERLKESASSNVPVIIYAARRAVEQKREIEARGAVLSTNKPTEVFQKVMELLG